jgi:hypothetical protein
MVSFEFGQDGPTEDNPRSPCPSQSNSPESRTAISSSPSIGAGLAGRRSSWPRVRCCSPRLDGLGEESTNLQLGAVLFGDPQESILFFFGGPVYSVQGAKP